MKYPATPQNRQQGAILITSLVFLAVLTLLGLSSVMNSTLESRMANNMRQGQIAFQAAEAAAIAAEEWLRGNTISTEADVAANFKGASGLYSARQPNPGTLPSPVGFDYTDPTAWPSANSVAVSGLDSNLAQPRYIIEYMGRTEISTGNVRLRHVSAPLDPNSNNPDLREYAFRIVAIGWGYDTSAYQVLQSTFRKRLN